VKILLGWLDPREASDPEIYVAGITAVLSDYPIDVQRIVADPRSAILARYRDVWPFAERVRRACEDVYGPTRRRIERDRHIEKQLAEREQRDRELAAKPSQTEEEFKAEMAARGLPIEGRKQRVEADVILAKYGVSEALWNNIPDLPISHEDRAANGLPSPTPGHAERAAADLAARKALAARGEKPASACSPIESAIEREYAAHGIKPVMAGSMIVSPSLVKNLGKWRCDCHQCSQWQAEAC
jgi:hypothetical protein